MCVCSLWHVDNSAGFSWDYLGRAEMFSVHPVNVIISWPSECGHQQGLEINPMWCFKDSSVSMVDQDLGRGFILTKICLGWPSKEANQTSARSYLSLAANAPESGIPSPLFWIIWNESALSVSNLTNFSDRTSECTRGGWLPGDDVQWTKSEITLMNNLRIPDEKDNSLVSHPHLAV